MIYGVLAPSQLVVWDFWSIHRMTTPFLLVEEQLQGTHLEVWYFLEATRPANPPQKCWQKSPYFLAWLGCVEFVWCMTLVEWCSGKQDFFTISSPVKRKHKFRFCFFSKSGWNPTCFGMMSIILSTRLPWGSWKISIKEWDVKTQRVKTHVTVCCFRDVSYSNHLKYVW